MCYRNALTTLLLFLISSTVFSQNSLEVIIENVDTPNRGTVIIGLFNSEKSYNNNLTPQGYSKEVKVTQTPLVITYDNLPAGKYAIKTYHDANDNKKFDKSLLGLPKEQYGFSNNEMGVMGPPSFSQSAFLIQGKTQHTIILR